MCRTLPPLQHVKMGHMIAQLINAQLVIRMISTKYRQMALVCGAAAQQECRHNPRVVQVHAQEERQGREFVTILTIKAALPTPVANAHPAF